MEYLSSGKILLVDLDSAKTSEEVLTESLLQEKIGGAALNRYLYEKHAAADPIVIGTGLLTGSIYPAACAAILTAKSPLTGKIAHAPVTLKVGLEIKYSGFDYIVIKGTSSKPAFLWIHDGIADIADAADVWGQDVWATTDAWRKSLGDSLIQTMLIGKAGEERLDHAQVCLNYWGSGDRFGFGKLFGMKKLKGLAFRGMGLLEIADAEEFIELSLDMLEDLKEAAFVGKKGIADICTAVGETGIEEWLAPVVHRHSSCFNTPYAGNTFVFLNEDPARMNETDVEEPGFLITEIFGLSGFKKIGLDARGACLLLRACARFGIDPVAVSKLSLAAGYKTIEEIQSSLSQMDQKQTSASAEIFSPCFPKQPLFGKFEGAGTDTHAWWQRRMAVAYIFGIHPLMALMAPELAEEDLLETASVGTGIELDQNRLNQAIQSIF